MPPSTNNQNQNMYMLHLRHYIVDCADTDIYNVTNSLSAYTLYVHTFHICPWGSTDINDINACRYDLESFETVNPNSCLALNAGLQAATNSSKAQTKHHPRQVAESSLGSSLEGLYLSLESRSMGRHQRRLAEHTDFGPSDIEVKFWSTLARNYSVLTQGIAAWSKPVHTCPPRHSVKTIRKIKGREAKEPMRPT